MDPFSIYFLHEKNVDYNFFQNENITLQIIENHYNDKFYIYYEKNKIYIQRVDKLCGWGQNLKMLVNYKDVITVGLSTKNRIIIHHPIENDNHSEFKIYAYSPLFRDRFDVSYNDSTITVKRLDSNEGWGQNLLIKTSNHQTITIGPSQNNIKQMNIDLSKYSVDINPNIFFSENYKIVLLSNIENISFQLTFFEKTNIIHLLSPILIPYSEITLCFIPIKNKDFEDKDNSNNSDNSHNSDNTQIIKIKTKNQKEVFQQIQLTHKKYYVALSTIPSRANDPSFIERVEYFIQSQSLPFENIFITVCKKYKRFDKQIKPEVIHTLKNIPKVIFIELEDDYGPGSKYIGPLLHYSDMLVDQILIVIDDDRTYNTRLVEHFNISYCSYPNVHFFSGLWNTYFDKDYIYKMEEELELISIPQNNSFDFKFGSGLGGFFGFAVSIYSHEFIKDFIDYHIYILSKIDDSFYHDEGISLNYMKFRNETLVYLIHYGCNFIKNELSDALCSSNLCDRSKVENDIYHLTLGMNLLNNF